MFLPILAALLPFIPQVAKWIGGSNAENVASKVVGIAQTVTGVSDPNSVIPALQQNPDLVLKLQQAVLDNQVEIEKIHAEEEQAELAADTADTAAVNTTMQVEAKADHWPTYSWRPAVGFAFAILALMAGLTVMGAYIGVMFFHVEAAVLSNIPGMLGAVAVVMGTMAPVIGIASYFRGKMQADPNIPTDNRG